MKGGVREDIKSCNLGILDVLLGKLVLARRNFSSSCKKRQGERKKRKPEGGLGGKAENEEGDIFGEMSWGINGGDGSLRGGEKGKEEHSNLNKVNQLQDFD